MQPKQTQTKPSFLNMTACLGIRWPLFDNFGPILGGFEVWVYMPSSRTASPENELLGICKKKPHPTRFPVKNKFEVNNYTMCFSWFVQTLMCKSYTGIGDHFVHNVMCRQGVL
ncbi:PREDICTED: PRUPE_2G001100 [Prunus dulcis]|uniref:PREDICTED: PRUPE_2G001100 n=1 Tax=Prunus dulcis TaxID=3755 RepID=A0A5E4FXP5_PRUDU|nr:PREDICTED: PRUPE_2G001100 [Prunus dulcis]